MPKAVLTARAAMLQPSREIFSELQALSQQLFRRQDLLVFPLLVAPMEEIFQLPTLEEMEGE
ncbi:MAG: hypothetical protein EAZ10_06750 [Oscillatoriales cyanobacterium]|nr:MAG: hypothetical protein EAZ10_06750 [Oscillatoriales cyanobacterium]